MISAEALVALTGIEHGKKFNTLHTTARELMGLGFAQDDWGQLGLTELGRIYLRRGRFSIAITGDDNVHDMGAVHMMQIPEGASIDRTPKQWWRNRMIDPMAAPHRVQVNDHQDEQTTVPTRAVELLPEAPPEPLPVAESRMQEMLRAAGVASGVTGVWVDAAWLSAFVRALDEGGVFSGTETSAENTP